VATARYFNHSEIFVSSFSALFKPAQYARSGTRTKKAMQAKQSRLRELDLDFSTGE